jgi:hypothetical protein
MPGSALVRDPEVPGSRRSRDTGFAVDDSSIKVERRFRPPVLIPAAPRTMNPRPRQRRKFRKKSIKRTV